MRIFEILDGTSVRNYSTVKRCHSGARGCAGARIGKYLPGLGGFLAGIARCVIDPI